jgi:hypothetical protein
MTWRLGMIIFFKHPYLLRESTLSAHVLGTPSTVKFYRKHNPAAHTLSMGMVCP